MDTFTNPQPTTHEPVPARDGREVPSRLRVLATSLAVAGLTATGGLAVILSTGATGGTTLTPSTATGGTTTTLPGATAAPAATAPTATQSTTTAAQPPQPAQGSGPGHASSGGS
jgi:hypothetical protein